MKKYIKTLIKEIIPVVIGILVALYINDWNENRKDQKYVDQIFSSISKELTETKKDIADKIVRQQSFIDTLDFYMDDNRISLLDITVKAKGVYMPLIKINSWKAISNSKIELIEYDKVSVLANIEEQKKIFDMKGEKLVDFLYSNTNEKGKDKKEFMKILLSDIIGSEIPLQKEIEKIIDK